MTPPPLLLQMADSCAKPSEEKLRHYFFNDIPLPPNYRTIITPDGKTEYFDEVTQEISSVHPAQKFFEERGSISKTEHDTAKFSLQTNFFLNTAEWAPKNPQALLEGRPF